MKTRTLPVTALELARSTGRPALRSQTIRSIEDGAFGPFDKAKATVYALNGLLHAKADAGFEFGYILSVGEHFATFVCRRKGTKVWYETLGGILGHDVVSPNFLKMHFHKYYVVECGAEAKDLKRIAPVPLRSVWPVKSKAKDSCWDVGSGWHFTPAAWAKACKQFDNPLALQ